MRIDQALGATALAGALGVALLCSGCAAGMGSMAGTAVGGVAKGGVFVVKATGKSVRVAGRTVRGASRGVHEEFNGSNDDDDGEPVAADDEAYLDDAAADEEPAVAEDDVGS